MIYKELEKLKRWGKYPFHMPGHKRKKQDIFQDSIFNYDITEITGYDDLHHPEGMIKESMDEIRKIYQTKKSYFLINSSTAGILTAIAATCGIGDKILVARNCHKSVYHGIQLLGLEPVYVYPEIADDICMGITAKQIKDVLKEESQIQAVLIVSPTYEGNISEVEAIANIVHEYDIPLIVDEAHGAHFIFHEAFPRSAVCLGADVVIQSLHKTLPSLTQTGLLHLNGTLVKQERIEEYLGVFQTSSPSYILMASIDYAVRKSANSKDLYEEYITNLRQVRSKLKELEHLQLLSSDDLGKIVVSTKKSSISGERLFRLLRDKYNMELEMAELDYVIAMTSVEDDQKALLDLTKALFEIDQRLTLRKKDDFSFAFAKGEICMSPYEAKKKEGEWIPIEQAGHRVSHQFVYLYPPGIPLLAPGEKVTNYVIKRLDEYERWRMKVIGVKNGQIEVIKEG